MNINVGREGMDLMEAVANTSVLDSTIDMLQMLNDHELQAIQSVARVFIMKPQIERPYQPLSEDQLLARVDAALEHVSAGLYENAEDIEKELISEFGL